MNNPGLTLWHANAVALGVQQASYLGEVTVVLAVVLIHGALQQVGVVGVEHLVEAFLRALHKHTGLLGVNEVPHALVGLVPRVLWASK